MLRNPGLPFDFCAAQTALSPINQTQCILEMRLCPAAERRIYHLMAKQTNSVKKKQKESQIPP